MEPMTFHWGDLYPAESTFETGNLANPDSENQEALNEDADIAKAADAKTARPKFIWLAVGVIVGVIVLMGMD